MHPDSLEPKLRDFLQAWLASSGALLRFEGCLRRLGLLRQRLEYLALKRAVREQQNLYHATEILIEDKASGTQL